MESTLSIQSDSLDVRVSENKFLGVIIDDKLSWESHIKHIEHKLSQSISILSNTHSGPHITPHSLLFTGTTLSELLRGKYLHQYNTITIHSAKRAVIEMTQIHYSWFTFKQQKSCIKQSTVFSPKTYNSHFH